MKNLKITALAFAFLILLNSCECDTIIVQPCQVTEQVAFDSQDNLIKLNGVWLQNLNLDVQPFVPVQWLGVMQTNDPQIMRVIANRPLKSVSLVGFPYAYQLERVNAYEFKIHSEGFTAYVYNTDIFYFLITY